MTWQKFVEGVRKAYGITKTRKYEPITLDYTDEELAVLRQGGKIARKPNLG